jgi:RNA recognition motif. (a.k.a. RRM, RBD, or RNP domain)
MSTNATQDPRNSGNNRRRRNRGGSNRNQNERGPREHSDERGPRGADSNDRNSNRRHDNKRSDEFRPQGSRPARTYAPVKVSFWQKILNAIGLGKKPASAPARPERKPRNNDSTPFPTGDRAPKSNTRNARSAEGETRPAREPREPREPRQPREKRPQGENEERSRGGNRNSDRPRGGDPKSVESTRVYVGNLSYDVTEQDLQELFKGIGGVRNIEIVYNRSTHRSKGYGFVEMLRLDDAVRSVEVLHDQPFMGRKMTVSGAKSKGQDDREDLEARNEPESVRVVLASTKPAVIVAAESSVPEEVAAATETEEVVATAAVEEVSETAPVAETTEEKTEVA